MTPTVSDPRRKSVRILGSCPEISVGRDRCDRLLLLRHRMGVAWVVLRGALQHGHRARVVARATVRCRRIVAIELATCRSGRTGGASGFAILGNAKRRELIGGIAGS